MNIQSQSSQLWVLIAMSIVVTFFLWHTSRKQRVWRSSLICCCTAALLFCISALYTYIRPITWMTRTTDVFTIYLGAVYSRAAFDDLLNGHSNYRVWKTKLFLTGIVLASFISGLNFFQQDNLGLISDGNAYIPNALYYISQSLHFTFLGTFLYFNYKTIKKGYSNAKTRVQEMRALLLLASAIIGIFGMCLSTDINIFFSILYNQPYIPVINIVYQFSYVFIFVLVASGVLLSQSKLLWIAQPFELYDLYILRYLISKLYLIMPSMKTDEFDVGSKSLSLLVHIDDISRVIWTNVTMHRSVTPEDEAKVIVSLIKGNTTFITVGNCTPPIMTFHSLRYYLCVAQAVRRFERNKIL